MIWRVCLICLCVIAARLGVAAEIGTGQWLLVTPPAFLQELKPLIDHRRAEGFQVQILEVTNAPHAQPTEQSEAIRNYLREWSRQSSGPHYVLLAGSMEESDKIQTLSGRVPPILGTVERMKGQPSDHAYALPERNGAPTVMVGRFPARSSQEIQGMMEKTLQLEREPTPGLWQNRLLLLTGDSGGGPAAEMLVEPALMPRLELLHPSWTFQAIFSTGSSRYHLPIDRARRVFLQEVNAGNFLTVFLGHSRAPGMWLSGNRFVTRADWSKTRIRGGLGIFFTCGCYACQVGGEEGPGYALTAMRHPGGPAAVIGALGETYAAPGALALDGLLERLQKPPFAARLGDYWKSVQLGLAKGRMPEILFSVYDRVDGSKGKVPLSAQRLEHLEMWMLLGDPALRLPLTALDIVLEEVESIRPGQEIEVRGVLPDRLRGAAVLVALERPLASRPDDLEELPVDNPANRAARERAILQNHERANRFLLAATNAITDGASFRCTIAAPPRIAWPQLIVRATATNAHELALGVLKLDVRREEGH